MTNVFDVAVYVLKKTGPISSMKLQKLVYYSQAWSLVWDDKALFRNKIEAWASGPVVRDLYNKHRQMFTVHARDFEDFTSGVKLADYQKETINAVLDAYGDKSAQWLSDQTHAEKPWQIARKGLSESERGSEVISLESMSEYYSALQ